MALGLTDEGVVLRYSLALTCRMRYLQSLIALQLESAKPISSPCHKNHFAQAILPLNDSTFGRDIGAHLFK